MTALRRTAIVLGILCLVGVTWLAFRWREPTTVRGVLRMYEREQRAKKGAHNETRWRCLERLERIGFEGHRDFLGLLRTGDTGERALAAQFLSFYDCQAVVNGLKEALSDREQVVRTLAIQSLSQIGSHALLECQGKILADPHWMVRWRFLSAVCDAPKKAVPLLIQHLEDTSADLRRCVSSRLSSLTGHDPGIDAETSIDEGRRAKTAWSEWWQAHEATFPAADLRYPARLLFASADRNEGSRPTALFAVGREDLDYEQARTLKSPRFQLWGVMRWSLPRLREQPKSMNAVAGEAGVWDENWSDARLMLLDESSPGTGAYDTLYFDTDSDGELADEQPARIAGRSRRGATRPGSARFVVEARRLLGREPGSPVIPSPVHIDIDRAGRMSYGRMARGRLLPAQIYRAEIGGANGKRRVTFVDMNYNGVLCEPFIDYCFDGMELGSEGLVGPLVRLGETYYRFWFAPDLCKVGVLERSSVQYATVRSSPGIAVQARCLYRAGATSFVATHTGDKVPSGRAQVTRLTISTTDKDGRHWLIENERGSARKLPVLDTSPGETLVLDVGPPFVAGIQARRGRERSYNLSIFLEDKTGVRYQAPRIRTDRQIRLGGRVVAESGQVIRSFKFRFG